MAKTLWLRFQDWVGSTAVMLSLASIWMGGVVIWAVFFGGILESEATLRGSTLADKVFAVFEGRCDREIEYADSEEDRLVRERICMVQNEYAVVTGGTFRRTEYGFKGTVQTLQLNFPVEIHRQVPRHDGQCPMYKIYSGGMRVGYGFIDCTEMDGRPYISITIDDPSFRAPFYAGLFDRGWEPRGPVSDEVTLYWSRG